MVLLACSFFSFQFVSGEFCYVSGRPLIYFFSCSYYADEGLGCEVFHYCQENQKHSWICPEGFSFHQVHLICMPPSGENICQQSSKYHVVNDYLYKPVNLAEHESKPNITLRYSERYYPESFYQDDRQDDYQQDRQRQPVSEIVL